MAKSISKPSRVSTSPRARAHYSRALSEFNREFSRILGLAGTHGHRADWRSSIDDHRDGDLVSVCDAARFLGVASKTLNNWRTTGAGPCYTKIGGRVLYRVAALRAYVAQRSRSNTGEAGQS